MAEFIYPTQYEREFPEDEAGGKLLDFCSEDCEEQIKAIFGDGEDTGIKSFTRSQSTCGLVSHATPLNQKESGVW